MGITVNEKTQMNIKNIKQAIEDYWKHTSQGTEIKENISETFIKRLAEDNAESKEDLRNLFRKSPNWHEELDALVINGNTTHNPDYDEVFKLMKTILEKPINEEVKKQASEKSLGKLPTKKLDDIYNTIYFFCCPADNSYTKKIYIESIQSLAPKAYAPGKKLSRIFKAVCVALGVADEKPGSEFQKLFAKVADEMNAKKINFKLYISLNPAHFMTMSNPKEDSRGSCLTSCHSFNSDAFPYNNGCTGYARDKVTMIAFTVDESNNPESLNNRKTTRQLFMYEPGNGLLLQSRMYNTSGGTVGAQEESKIYRELIQKEIALCEDTPNLWGTKTYCYNKDNIKLEAERNFGGYCDWEIADYAAKYSILVGHDETCLNFEIGKAGLCISCGNELCSDDGLICSDCIHKEENQCYHCGEYCSSNETYTVINADAEYVEVCPECYNEYYETCSCCDHAYPLDSLHVINREYICDECLEEHFTECADCGLYHRNSEMNEAIDEFGCNVNICDDCRDEHYTYCDICEGLEENSRITEVVNKNGVMLKLCNDCLKDEYVQCDECQEYIHKSLINKITDYNGEELNLCNDCLEEYIYCEDCGKYVNRDEVTDIQDKNGNEITVCPNCLKHHNDTKQDTKDKEKIA